jgi:hypothetical protein
VGFGQGFQCLRFDQKREDVDRDPGRVVLTYRSSAPLIVCI